jgi:hypothetical protein
MLIFTKNNLKNSAVITTEIPLLNEDIIKKSWPKYRDLLKMKLSKKIILVYEKFEHLYIMPFLMVIKIVKRLSIMFRLYNEKKFGVGFFFNGFSIIFGIVYIIYIDYPIFLGNITGNQIGRVCSILSFGCTIIADLNLGKAPEIF